MRPGWAVAMSTTSRPRRPALIDAVVPTTANCALPAAMACMTLGLPSRNCRSTSRPCLAYRPASCASQVAVWLAPWLGYSTVTRSRGTAEGVGTAAGAALGGGAAGAAHATPARRRLTSPITRHIPDLLAKLGPVSAAQIGRAHV